MTKDGQEIVAVEITDRNGDTAITYVALCEEGCSSNAVEPFRAAMRSGRTETVRGVSARPIFSN